MVRKASVGVLGRLLPPDLQAGLERLERLVIFLHRQVRVALVELYSDATVSVLVTIIPDLSTFLSHGHAETIFTIRLQGQGKRLLTPIQGQFQLPLHAVRKGEIGGEHTFQARVFKSLVKKKVSINALSYEPVGEVGK